MAGALARGYAAAGAALRWGAAAMGAIVKSLRRGTIIGTTTAMITGFVATVVVTSVASVIAVILAMIITTAAAATTAVLHMITKGPVLNAGIFADARSVSIRVDDVAVISFFGPTMWTTASEKFGLAAGAVRIGSTPPSLWLYCVRVRSATLE